MRRTVKEKVILDFNEAEMSVNYLCPRCKCRIREEFVTNGCIYSNSVFDNGLDDDCVKDEYPDYCPFCGQRLDWSGLYNQRDKRLVELAKKTELVLDLDIDISGWDTTKWEWSGPREASAADDEKKGGKL